MLVYVCICMHVYVCMYMYVCMCVCMYVCVCIHVYVCMHAYMCMYVCMHNILGGELSGGNVLPKTGGGISGGELSYTRSGQCACLSLGDLDLHLLWLPIARPPEATLWFHKFVLPSDRGLFCTFRGIPVFH